MKKLKKKIRLAKKEARWCVVCALVILLAFSANVALAEWREPDLPPTVEQDIFYPPLASDAQNQTRKGYLLLDPQYEPTEQSSLTFTADRPLDVRGEGARFSTPYVYGDTVMVNTDTLYADSVNEWVGIGTDVYNSPGVRLKVVGGTVQVGTEAVPVAGRAVSGYGQDGAIAGVGIYGEAGVTGTTGVHGLRIDADGLAVRGESDHNAGVMGRSDDGYGIYGVTSDLENAAVYAQNTSSGWAGYFDGRLGAGSDVVADRFVPTHLQKSLVPFTSGQEVDVYDLDIGGTWPAQNVNVALAFDGTYIWAATTYRINVTFENLFKVRASDGVIVDSYGGWMDDLSNIGYSDVVYDGRYLWLAFSGGNVARFDPEDGAVSLVSGLSANTKDDLQVSTIGGQVYIWIADQAADTIYRVNAEDVNDVASYDVTTWGIGDPRTITFDGEYIWVGSYVDSDEEVLRIWAQDPNDADYPPVVVDTSTASYTCRPRSLFFDGEYIWCLPGQLAAGNHMVRIWAEDPNDLQHPIIEVGDSMNYTKEMAFDGTYLWVVNHDDGAPLTQGLYRYLAADPTQGGRVDSSFKAERVLFDGTYIWVSEEDTGPDPPKLHKYFSGTGLGHSDLGNVVNLDPSAAQEGGINVSGSAEIGGNATVGDDLIVTGNQWQGSDETVAVSGTANCSDGYFIKGITLDGDSKLSEIVCRGL